jgi:hypothetical protein
MSGPYTGWGDDDGSYVMDEEDAINEIKRVGDQNIADMDIAGEWDSRDIQDEWEQILAESMWELTSTPTNTTRNRYSDITADVQSKTLDSPLTQFLDGVKSEWSSADTFTKALAFKFLSSAFDTKGRKLTDATAEKYKADTEYTSTMTDIAKRKMANEDEAIASNKSALAMLNSGGLLSMNYDPNLKFKSTAKRFGG